MIEFGYISDQPWQHTYQRSLSPQNIRLAMAMAGQEMPPLSNICELAYGQGLSLCIHAACNPQISWIGTDFNPGHVASARSLASSGRMTNLALSDQDLSTFCAREDLARCDLITMRGTWSWLPMNVQKLIADYLPRALTPRGLFCFDYSTLPGANGVTGLNHILDALAQAVGGDGGAPIVERIPMALRQALTFMDTNPAFVGMHWRLRSTTEALLKQNASHVAHEYFNHNVSSTYFSDLAEMLAETGLSWAAPCAPTAGIDSLHLTPRQAVFLQGISDVHRRETLRDFTLNTARRAEIWSMSNHADMSVRNELVGQMSFVLTQPVSLFDFKMVGGLGEMALSQKLYAQLLKVLGKLRPTKLADLCDAVTGYATIDEVCDAIAILVEKGMAQVISEDGDISGSEFRPALDLNNAIIDRSKDSNEIGYLGSPMTGAGVQTARHHQLFLLAMRDGVRAPSALATFAKTYLKPTGDQPLPTEFSDINLLEREAEVFTRDWHPIYATLGIE